MKILNKELLKSKIYTTSYFTKTKEILKYNNINNVVTMQFKSFCEDEYMVCGINEIIEVLKVYIDEEDIKKLDIKYFPDGTIMKPGKCVLSITGEYQIFCEVENIIDSILARRSSVATNCWKILKEINYDQLLFMADRSDDYQLHPFDGYSAYVAGVRFFSNQSHIELINDDSVKVVGTMPHSLIHQFDGDIVRTFKAYKELYPNNVTILIDFNNDIIFELKKLIPYFSEIQAVRIDTSSSVTDKSLDGILGNNGVSHKLVCLCRDFLNSNAGNHIKIVASSGIGLEKVLKFKELNAPVDKYGIGSSLIKVNLHFTADLVKTNNKEFAKFGRKFIGEDGMIKYGG
ncbi:MAG: nicotinate phosphoribosyltransferase [Mycoplasma sp.]